jgi:hypothetical protein
MGIVKHLAAEIKPCAEQNDCLNSPVHRPEQLQCRFCKLAVAGGGPMNCWKPWAAGAPHPKLAAEKKQAAQDRRETQAQKRKAVSRPKQALARKAARAEKQTETNFIAATRNSGRIAKDGDQVQVGRITLDTKLQTGNIHPVVHLDELDKVRADARRGGNPIGALVLRNKHGRAVVVFDESDYALMFAQIVKGMVRELVAEATT